VAYEPTVNKRKLQYQQTLENIRNAVDKLVAEKGFESMTIRDICKESGIKAGGFYHHFDSKDALLFDRYHRMNQYFTALYESDLQGKDSVEGLLLLSSVFFAYLKSRVLSIMIQYNKTYVANQKAWEEKEPNACFMVICRLMEEGQKNNEIKKDFKAKDLSCFLWSLIQGATRSYCASEGTFLEESNLEYMIQVWIRSLRVEG